LVLSEAGGRVEVLGIAKPLSLIPYTLPLHPFLSGQLLPEVKATQQAMIESGQLQPIDQLECIAL
jgi:hypothetical protein